METAEPTREPVVSDRADGLTRRDTRRIAMLSAVVLAGCVVLTVILRAALR